MTKIIINIILLVFFYISIYAQKTSCNLYVYFDSTEQVSIDKMNAHFTKYPESKRAVIPLFIFSKLSDFDYLFYKSYFQQPPIHRLEYFILALTGGNGEEEYYYGEYKTKPKELLDFVSSEIKNNSYQHDWLWLFEPELRILADITSITGYDEKRLYYFGLGPNFNQTQITLISETIKVWQEKINKQEFYYAQDSSSFSLQLSHFYSTPFYLRGYLLNKGSYTDKRILEMYVSFPVCKRIAVLPCLLENLELEEQLVDLFQTDLNTLTESTTPQFYKNGVLDKKKLQIAIDIWKTKIECSF